MGGLGNQLFQIFATISYAMKYGQTFGFLFKEKLGNNRITYWNTFLKRLSPFVTFTLPHMSVRREDSFEYSPILAPLTRTNEQHYSLGTQENYNSFSSGNLIMGKGKELEFPEGRGGCQGEPWVPPTNEVCENVYLFGYFQSEKYFKPHIDVIKNLIGIDELQQKIFQKFNFLCDFTNTVSMHFRLGDYKYLPEHHPVLEYEYYENAVRYILNKNDNQNIQHYPPGTQENYNSFSSRNLIMGKGKELEFPEGWGGCQGEPPVPPKNITILYFCEKEDNNEVQDMIQRLSSVFDNTCSFVKAPDQIDDWEQMLLMSCCRHNIIANSTFSWWGAYFNNNLDKIVCYPSKWFGVKLAHHNLCDLFPKGWSPVENL
jgi:hypothetical protein